MNVYKACLLMVSFMTYMIMAGLLTQIGIIIKPISEYLDISITDAAAMFSYLTGGTLVGTFISMGVYSRFKINHILRVTYTCFLVVIAALALLNIKDSFIVSCYLLILGICCGIGLSGGAVVISKIFNENQRASAFIATDCAFSASGYIFPTIATLIIAANMAWTNAYAIVGLVAVLVVISTFILRYPDNESVKNPPEDGNKLQNNSGLKDIFTIRVLLMGLALCLYLFAQSTFLTWAPGYLEEHFGLSSSESGMAVSNYWGPSVFGLITAAILVNKIPARLMLIIVMVVAIVVTFFLSTTDNAKYFLTMTLGFGFLTSCVYKLGISVGSQQIKNSPAVLITFLLTCGTIGSTAAPALSAFIVARLGIASAMVTTNIAFVAVCIAVIACLLLEKIENAKSK